MSSTSQGTVLAGRYRLERRIQTDPDGSLWRARDATLDRPVSIRVLRGGHPFAADVADAARRAALVDDPRLVRVLDVGTDGTVSFVVSEHVLGESLATTTERGPLPGPAIRRIIGEVAEGLAGAAARGLHHLRLTPRSVLICSDGSVKLIGTAVEAAAAGLEPDHASGANRTDAIGLIALLYSGLTGRWPLGDAGFPPAPHGDSGPVPPGELVRGVPHDLDTLCVVTLGSNNDGPRSPAEVARQLAPWPSAAEVVATAAAPPAPAGEVSRPASVVTSSSRPKQPPPASSLFAPITPVSPGAIRDARATAAARGDAPAGPGSSNGRGQRTPASAQAQQPAAPAQPSAAPARPSVTAARPPSAPTQPLHTPAPMPALQQPAAAGPAPGGQAGPADRQHVNGARPAGQATGPHPDPRERRDKRSARRPLDTGEMLMPWSGTWTPAPQSTIPADATGPFPILIPADPPPNHQSRLVLVGVAVALVVGLVLAVFSLRDFGSSGDPGSRAVSPVTATSDDQAPPATTAPALPSRGPVTPTATPSSVAAPLAIAGIEAMDPQGDNNENNSDAKKVLDGRSSTQWRSDTYKSSSFGGLKKGVGLAIQLKQPARISGVQINIRGSGGTVELRGGNSAGLAGSAVLGTAAISGGPVSLASASTDRFNYVIIWFTKLPKAGGNYRLEVSEVRVT